MTLHAQPPISKRLTFGSAILHPNPTNKSNKHLHAAEDFSGNTKQRKGKLGPSSVARQFHHRLKSNLEMKPSSNLSVDRCPFRGTPACPIGPHPTPNQAPLRFTDAVRGARGEWVRCPAAIRSPTTSGVEHNHRQSIRWVWTSRLFTQFFIEKKPNEAASKREGKYQQNFYCNSFQKLIFAKANIWAQQHSVVFVAFDNAITINIFSSLKISQSICFLASETTVLVVVILDSICHQIRISIQCRMLHRQRVIARRVTNTRKGRGGLIDLIRNVETLMRSSKWFTKLIVKR